MVMENMWTWSKREGLRLIHTPFCWKIQVCLHAVTRGVDKIHPIGTYFMSSGEQFHYLFKKSKVIFVINDPIDPHRLRRKTTAN